MHDRPARNPARFSVIIPAYNAEKTIERAISSVLAQSYPPDEIIIVDDCSSDKTVSIAKTFQPAVTIYALHENNGPSFARNTGWDHASGDYIAFLDADDLWHKDKLKIIQTLLHNNDYPTFVFHSFSLQPLDQHINEPLPGVQHLAFRRLVWRIPPIPPCHPSAVVLKNKKEFRFETSMRYMEDYDLWLRIAARYNIYYLLLPLTQLGRPVLSAGGQSSNRPAMRMGEFKAYKRLALRQPEYLLQLPFLFLISALKHLIKMFTHK